MLKSLLIHNFALIDSLTIDFEKGLSILTGETGAGKSVLIGTLSLLEGARTDVSRLREKDKKGIVEAVFTPSSFCHLKPLFEHECMQWDDNELILRREVNPQGRSRIFVNDSPVSLKQLTALGCRLIDIHSQHSNLMLADSGFRLKIIDLFSDNNSLLTEYRETFKHYASLRAKLKKAKTDMIEAQTRHKVLEMQLQRLQSLSPKLSEVESLEKEQELLSMAESLAFNLGNASSALSQGDDSAVERLEEALDSLRQVNLALITSVMPEGDDLIQRLNGSYLEIKDIAEIINGCASEITPDPARLEAIQARLDNYYDVMTDFRVNNPDELVKLMEDIEQKLLSLDNDDRLHALEQKTASAGAELRRLAIELTASRKAGAERFASMLIDTARPLGMANIRFVAEVSQAKLSVEGADYIDFLCSFNKNTPLLQVQKVASGGEMSRLMLSLKAIAASKLHIPTLVFDEIDTGVSGDIADKMGRMMQAISRDVQVIAITHLPQVAALGSNHYKISKHDTESATFTEIARLTQEERTEEIARMLSGRTIDDAARENALSMLNQNFN